MADDLALYYEDEVVAGIRDGDFERRLRSAIENFRATFEERVPEHIRRQKDFVRDALESMIHKKMLEGALGDPRQPVGFR